MVPRLLRTLPGHAGAETGEGTEVVTCGARPAPYYGRGSRHAVLQRPLLSLTPPAVYTHTFGPRGFFMLLRAATRGAARLLAARTVIGPSFTRVGAVSSSFAVPQSRSFALLSAVSPPLRRPSAVTAAVIGPPALITEAAPLALTQQVRHKKGNRRVPLAGNFRPKVKNTPYAGRGNFVWWQPLLPAMAPLRVRPMEGSGRSLKRAMQKQQQIIWNHAIRKEGKRRNAIFKQVKREKEQEKVMAVYAQYGEILRQRALAAKAEAEKAKESDPSVDIEAFVEAVMAKYPKPDMTSTFGRKLPARTLSTAAGDTEGWRREREEGSGAAP